MTHKIFFLFLSFFYICSYSQIEYKKFFYPNGSISSEGFLKNGKPDGYWKTYYPNGKIKSEGKRTNFIIDSTWIFYDENGDTIEKINYYLGQKNGFYFKYYTKPHNIIKSKELYVNNSKEGLSFYYYDNGKIWKIIPFENNIEHGIAKEFDNDSIIITITEYFQGRIVNNEQINRYNLNGQKDGIWRYFYPNGKIKEEITYKDGEINGIVKTYNINGNLLSTILYKNNQIVDNNYSDTTTFDTRKIFDDNGNLVSEGYYKNNIPIGIHRFYNKNKEIINSILYNDYGQKIAEGIIDENGRYQGNFKFFFPNGNIKSEGSYINGRRIGKWIFYYQSGKVEQIGYYKNGFNDGLWQWFYENGKIFREEEFTNGKENGIFKEYFIDGNIITEGNYIDGMKEGTWYYNVGDCIKKGNYINGYMDGKWQYFYLNGKLMFEGYFLRDNPDKKHVYYYDNGKIMEEQFYNNGIKTKTWKKYDPAGNLIYTVTYKNDVEYKINGVKLFKNFN